MPQQPQTELQPASIHKPGLPWTIATAFGDIEFYGWQSVVGEAPPRFHRATKTPGRSIVTCSGKHGVFVVRESATQHPRDKFDKKIGKWLSLGRLVKRLLPDSLVPEKKFLPGLKAERSRIFRLIWTEMHGGKFVDPTARVETAYLIQQVEPLSPLAKWWSEQKSLDNSPSKT